MIDLCRPVRSPWSFAVGRLQTRLQEIVQQFGLEAYARTGADLLPGGKAVSGHGQRLTARVRDRVFG